MTRLAWIAAKEGIAHAAIPGFARTLCGARAQDPRWSWPTTERCAECQALELWPAVQRVPQPMKR